MDTNLEKNKVCYFGNIDLGFSRNKIFKSGLMRVGVKVVECIDTGPGITKFVKMWKKHKALIGTYDFILVGYPGHISVLLAKIVSKKPVVADLLGSLYDAEKNSHSSSLFRLVKNFIVDFIAVFFADVVLLESEAQKRYFEKRFGRRDKFKVVYTSADAFFTEKEWKFVDGEYFKVLFRGSLTPESGVHYILDAAKLLINEKIQFSVVGRGRLLREVESRIKKEGIVNVELMSKYLSEDELIAVMLDTHLSLGQFEDNPRLNRTIPHKAFESMALGIPYMTGDAEAVKEVVENDKTGFIIPLASAKDIADKILDLSRKDKKTFLEDVSKNMRTQFKERFSLKKTGEKIVSTISKCLERSDL